MKVITNLQLENLEVKDLRIWTYPEIQRIYKRNSLFIVSRAVLQVIYPEKLKNGDTFLCCFKRVSS
jgi:hypothetical protein